MRMTGQSTRGVGLSWAFYFAEACITRVFEAYLGMHQIFVTEILMNNYNFIWLSTCKTTEETIISI
jgi:hypothetical protein